MSHWQHLRSSQGSQSFKLGVVVQWCCHFNDSHQWVFPPPISTNLVVCCSVRGRSLFCCGSSSTVSSFFLLSFKSNLRTRPRKHPFGLNQSLFFVPLCYQIGFAIRFQCLRPPLFAATLYWNPPWTLPCNKSMGLSEGMINNPESFLVRCTYALLQRASPNDVIMTSFV